MPSPHLLLACFVRLALRKAGGVWCLLWLVSPLGGLALSAVELQPVDLKTGQAVELAFGGVSRQASGAGGCAAKTARVVLPGPGYWLIEAEQQGVDVRLTLRESARSSNSEESTPYQQIAVDSPFDRWGLELLLFQTEGREERVLVLDCVESRPPPGSVRLALVRLPGSDGGGAEGSATAMRREALDFRTRASEAYLTAGPSGWQAAREGFADSADLWRRLGEQRRYVVHRHAEAVLERLLGDTDRAYELSSEVLGLWRQLGEPFWEATSLNEVGLSLWKRSEEELARDAFKEAVRLRQGLGDRQGELLSRGNVCLTHYTAGELVLGLRCAEPLLALLEDGLEPQIAGAVHTNAGWAQEKLGNLDQALDHYSEALRFTALAGDELGQAKALNNMAHLHRRMGEFQAGLDAYEEALTYFRGVGDRRWQGIVLNNIGSVYNALGEPTTARTLLEESLSLRRQVSHRRGEAITLNNLGVTYALAGNDFRAAGLHQKALELSKEIGNSREEGFAQRLFGRAQLRLGDASAAVRSASAALELFEQVGDRLNQALALLLLGEAELGQGKPSAALARLGAALEVVQDSGDPRARVAVLTAMARAHNELGSPDHALWLAQEAIEEFELLRTGVFNWDLRATFRARHQGSYSEAIRALFRKHELEPEGGFARLAFELNERSRSRSLLEQLSSRAEGLLSTSDEGSVTEEAARLSALRQQTTRDLKIAYLRLPTASDESRTALRETIGRLTRQLDSLEQRVRGPLIASSAAAASLEAVQAELEPGTALIQFALGEPKSFVWIVEGDRLRMRSLAGRAELVRLVEASDRDFRQVVFQRPSQVEGNQNAVEALSQELLEPWLGELTSHRLAFVGDGILETVPFAALVPSSPGQLSLASPPRLVDSHEVVVLPSASMLLAARSKESQRRRWSKAAMVLADPVFSLADDRLHGAQGRSLGTAEVLRAGPSYLDGGAPSRLMHSREEAELIRRHFVDDSDQRLDFEASKRLFTSREVEDYRLIHVASHGFSDRQRPRLSGLELSRFDRQGDPVDGFLSLFDVYELNLSAELVVLSACETAVGRQVEGEGLFGLARGFIVAGTPRVIASLWKVEDRATLELMSRFYEALTREGSPAKALRSAQLQLKEHARWSHPHYWAGFALIGDWQAPALPWTAGVMQSDN